MIQVDNLSIAYHGNYLFDGVSFTIGPKERCAFVGRNGSGKTTLLRLLIGQEEPDSGAIALSKGYKIGYLDQHIRFSQATVIEEACLGLREEEKDSAYKAEKILCGLGFKEEELYLPPEQFSGGYQLRLHLAKVLLSQPNCLLLDEPTNYLDILAIRFLTQFLQQWKGEMILISHDREFIDAVCTHTLGIHRNKIRKVKGSTLDFFNQIAAEEEIQERTRSNLEKKREHLQSFIERFGAKASKAAQAQSKQKMLNRIPALEQLKKLYQLDFDFHFKPFSGKKMLETKKIDFSYDDHPIVHDLSLLIEPKDRIAIIGKNGYGKSTLLRLLARDLKPQNGEIISSDQLTIGYFGQTHIQRLAPNHTIEEEIASANPQMNFTDVKRVCGTVMFSGDTAKKKISVLSGGEKSRVLLGKILAHPCNLLLLDEPTHHLDIESVEALIDALEDFPGAFVIVTHSELILRRLPLNKLIVCHAGRQEQFIGSYDEFLEKVGWEEENPPPKKSRDDTRKQLKVFEHKVQKLEKTILSLEEQQEKDEALLSSMTEPNQIEELFQKTDARAKKIHALYEELFQASAELERARKT